MTDSKLPVPLEQPVKYPVILDQRWSNDEKERRAALGIKYQVVCEISGKPVSLGFPSIESGQVYEVNCPCSFCKNQVKSFISMKTEYLAHDKARAEIEAEMKADFSKEWEAYLRQVRFESLCKEYQEHVKQCKLFMHHSSNLLKLPI